MGTLIKKLVLFPLVDDGYSQQEVMVLVLNWVFTVLTVLGLPLIVMGVIEALSFGSIIQAGQYLVLYLPIAAAQFLRRRLPYQFRFCILFLSVYGLAIGNLLAYGFSGAAIPLFFTLFILSALFFTLRGGLIAVGVSIVPLGIVGWLMVTERAALSVDLEAITLLPVSWITAGSVMAFLGTIMVVSISVIKVNLLRTVDLNYRQRMDLEEANRRLSGLLAEKDILLREVNHRVGNNLNIIISMLSLKASQMKSPEDALAAFQESQDQIYSLALVHQKAYSRNDFSRINMSEYAKDLVSVLLQRLGKQNIIKTVVDVFISPLSLNTAVSCGSIITQLITNVSEHNFPDDQPARVILSFSSITSANGSSIQLMVSDNGKEEEVASLGHRLVALQVEQLQGSFSVDKGDDGVTVTIVFPLEGFVGMK